MTGHGDATTWAAPVSASPATVNRECVRVSECSRGRVGRRILHVVSRVCDIPPRILADATMRSNVSALVRREIRKREARRLRQSASFSKFRGSVALRTFH
jgi:hypothetical protein